MPNLLPLRFAVEAELPSVGRLDMWRALDHESGQLCRVWAAPDEPAAGLALRQAHRDRIQLGGPAVVRPVALGQLADGRWYRAEQWVEALPAGATPAQLAGWVRGWLTGLAALHAAGRVHGCLSPAELGHLPGGAGCLASPGLGWLSGQNAGGGLPGRYAAPEQWAHGRVDARTDLFMLGAVLLEALCGLAAPRDTGALADLLDELPQDLADWADLLGGLLAPNQADRFSNAGEALAAVPGAETGALPAPVMRAAPFVGRREELRVLLGALDEAADTLAPRVMRLHGVAGIGKSRLLDELAQRARMKGFEVVRGSAAHGNGRPLATWGPLVETLLDRVPARQAAELKPALGPLLREAPRPAANLEPRAARARLFSAVGLLLEAAVSPPGLLLCVDDWDLADTASQDLLDFLTRALPAMPLAIVLAGRDAPADAAPGEQTRGDGGPGVFRGQYALGGLERRDADALCRGVWDGREPGGGMVAWLDEHDGLPALLEHGALACRTAVLEGQTVALALPATMQELWQARLKSLAGPARQLALAAAIAGPRTGLVMLAGVAELDEEACFDALETLAAGGLLVADGAGYTLQAPADAMLALAEPAEATGLHARCLAHLRVAHQLGQDVPVARLAHHALAGGEAREGAFYALEAARQALKLFALPEAQALLERGVVSLSQLPDAPAEWTNEYLIARGDLARFRAQGPEAEACYKRALAGAPLTDERRADVLTSLGIALNYTSRAEEAEVCYREAAGLPGAGPTAVSRALNALARMHIRVGKASEAARYCRQVLAMEGVPANWRGEALGQLGLVCVNHGGDVREGLQHLAEAKKLAEETGDRLALMNVCMLAGNARLGLGQLEPARDEFSHYALLSQELGLSEDLLCAHLNLAQVAYEQGRFQEAWQRARSGTAAAAEIGNLVYKAFGGSVQAMAGAQLGYLAESEAAMREAVKVAESLGAAVTLMVGVARLEMALFLGRFGLAEELALSLRELAGDDPEHLGKIAYHLGEVYAMSGETAAAIEQLRVARHAAVGNGNTLLQAKVALAFGRVAAASGQIAVARARGLDALALAEETGAGVTRLRAHLLVAQSSWQLGMPEVTDHHLALAHEVATGLACPHWQAMAWLAQSRLDPDGVSLRLKAATHVHFYLQQLAPRARQEFLHWPERRDAVHGRGTGALELRIEGAPRLSSSL